MSSIDFFTESALIGGAVLRLHLGWYFSSDPCAHGYIGNHIFLGWKQMNLMSFKPRSSSNLSMLILIWNHSRSPTWSKSSPPDVNQLLMRRRPILSNFTTGEERALLRFCCLMWRQRRNRNRTDQQTGMCSPLMRFDLKGKKERALLKCLIALLWIGNIFYNERYSSDLCRSKYTLKPCFVSFEQLFHNEGNARHHHRRH